jgi:hypothetical protein
MTEIYCYKLRDGIVHYSLDKKVFYTNRWNQVEHLDIELMLLNDSKNNLKRSDIFDTMRLIQSKPFLIIRRKA